MESQFQEKVKDFSFPAIQKKEGHPIYLNYCNTLHESLQAADWGKIHFLAETLLDCWKTGKRVFICGNGGSAANATHIANDMIYGISKKFGSGLKVQSLSANASVLTCLANDEGYDTIYSYQLAVLAEKGDVLIVLSSSGNSPNILKTLEVAKDMGVLSFGILGYSGGKAKELCDVSLDFPVHDVQISEDLQVIICHMVMQWLYQAAKG